MKRDMDLIRKMVLWVADSEQPRAPHPMEIEGYSEEQIGYHAYLIVDSGWAVGVDASDRGTDNPSWVLFYLTSRGQDFADVSRGTGIWEKAKEVVTEKVGRMTLGQWFDLLVRLSSSAIAGLSGRDAG